MTQARGRRWLVVVGLLTMLVALLAQSSVKVVRAREVGILQTFGKALVTPLQPGPHLVFPWAQVLEVLRPAEIKRLHVLAVGASDDMSKKGSVASPTYLLTADENLVMVESSVQYRVRAPRDFLFAAVERDALIRQLALDALTQILLNADVDDVLAKGRAGIQRRLRNHLQESINDVGLGVTVTSFLLHDVVPPASAVSAFQDVSSARANAVQLVSKAQAQASEDKAEVHGKAKKQVAEAETWAAKRRATTAGAVERFQQLHAEYKRNPALLKRRLSLEAQQRVLPAAKRVYHDGSTPAPAVHVH